MPRSSTLTLGSWPRTFPPRTAALTRAEGPVGTPQEVTMKQVHDRPVPGWLERLAVATFLAVVGLLMLTGLVGAIVRAVAPGPTAGTPP
jgi:hypothetical protein